MLTCMKSRQWLRETLPAFLKSQYFGLDSLLKSTLVAKYPMLFDFAQRKCLGHHLVTTARNPGISVQVEKHHLDMLQFIYSFVPCHFEGSYKMSWLVEGVM